MPPEYDNLICLNDCISGMACLPAYSADIVIADPPYNIGKNFGKTRDNLPLEEYIAWSKLWIRECLRILAPRGTFFIYGFPEVLAHISVTLPLNKQRWLQWHYTNKNMPNSSFWQRSHESILCVWKDKPIFNRDEIREPYTREFLANMAGRVRPASASRITKSGANHTIYNAHKNGAMPRDVIKIGSLAGGASVKERHIYCKACRELINPVDRKKHQSHDLIIHPTQKPLGLTKKLILSCRPKGNFNILVPFCGSGAECKCAWELGGSFVSFEINGDFWLLARSVMNNCMNTGTDKYAKLKANQTTLPCPSSWSFFS